MHTLTAMRCLPDYSSVQHNLANAIISTHWNAPSIYVLTLQANFFVKPYKGTLQCTYMHVVLQTLQQVFLVAFLYVTELSNSDSIDVSD